MQPVAFDSMPEVTILLRIPDLSKALFEHVPHPDGVRIREDAAGDHITVSGDERPFPGPGALVLFRVVILPPNIQVNMDLSSDAHSFLKHRVHLCRLG